MAENSTETASALTEGFEGSPFTGASGAAPARVPAPQAVETIAGAPRRESEAGKQMPPVVLAAAGLAVFDAIIAASFVAVWAYSLEMVLGIVHALAGICLLLGVAPIIVGGLILSRNRQSDTPMPGASAAVWAIISGALLATITLAIPLAAAVSVLLGGP